MNNASIASADRATHFKIVTVSLAASAVVLAVSIALHNLPADNGSATARVAHGPVIKAGKPMMTTTNDITVIR
jgi:hypothetical protein